ncbi:MAG: ankyrin repeat protein [Parasphingorhabdus sp.]|jgi:ankyrin repeat protein
MRANTVTTSTRNFGLIVAVVYLSGAGPVDNNLYQATQLGDPMRIEQLAGYGVNLDRPDHNGKTPLGIAIRNRDIMVVGMLLKLGANPNLIDSQNECLVWVAQSQNDPDIVQQLQNFGAKCHTLTSATSTTEFSGSVGMRLAEPKNIVNKFQAPP